MAKGVDVAALQAAAAARDNAARLAAANELIRAQDQARELERANRALREAEIARLAAADRAYTAATEAARRNK